MLPTPSPLDLAVYQMLRESNAIESVYDDKSLLEAIDAWDLLARQKKLTEDVVLEVHAILMRRHLRKQKERGHYRTIPVYVGRTTMTDPELIPDQMKAWLQGMNTIRDKSFFKRLHVEYEAIHPFVDGNGRTGRMFMNWHRLQCRMPILVIKESERWDYYKWFK